MVNYYTEGHERGFRRVQDSEAIAESIYLPLERGRVNKEEMKNLEETPPPKANKIWTSLERIWLPQEPTA